MRRNSLQRGLPMRHAPIDPQLFIENRRRLAAQLKPNSITVFNSSDVMPKSADGVHPFSQQTDLFYLSGIDQEESTLVLFPDAREEKHREVLFLRETSEPIALWEGQKYTKDEAAAASGVKTVYWNSQFDSVFRPLVFQAERIYLNSNEHLRAEAVVETRDTRFGKWCREAFPLHRYQRLAPIMHDLRAVKSSIEVELIRQAGEISGRAFRRLLDFIRPGVWEYEIEAEIWHEFLRARSRGPAFQTIVASGADSCTLHYVKNDKQCKDGDLVLIDFGAEYANYAGDLTRTVPVNGRFTPRQRVVYEAVLRVQKAAIQMLRPGNTLEAYTAEVGRWMEAELIGLGLLDAEKVKGQPKDQPLYKKYFPHGTSHHLGLDVHDYGDKFRPFEAGMVFTCEPGIYIREEGIGVRIENDILITDRDPVDLMADIPREADEIEELMSSMK
jgi:Xaa-Pro aminopeptidase